MFSLANWQNPETFMLNVANAALGIATLSIILGIAWKILRDPSAFGKHRINKH